MGIRDEETTWKFGERVAFKNDEGDWIHTAVLGTRLVDDPDYQPGLSVVEILVCPEKQGDTWILARNVTSE